MIKRHHKILAGVLIAQIVLSVVIFWPRPSSAGQREPLFPNVEPGNITALTIESAGGDVIQLAKATDEWVLPEADDYPVQADKVSSFLEKLTALTTGRLVTRSDTSHKRLQVSPNEFARRISFETNDGARHALYLGSSPRFGSVHFRLEGQDETYLTSDLTTYDVNAATTAWIDTTYHTVSQEHVTRITLQNANGTFTFEKDDEGTWTMADLAETETLDETQVTSLLRRAARVTMKEPLGKEARPSYGMDQPNAVVTLEIPDKTLTLRVGEEEAGEGDYVVKSSESDYYVTVSEAAVKTILENDREAFLKEPPTPEAESDGS